MAERLPPEGESEHQPVFQTTKLTWRLLPPGRRITEHIAGQQYFRTSKAKSWDRERLVLLDSLQPLEWYEGAHLGQTVYFVAVFKRVAIWGRYVVLRVVGFQVNA
jgi:hypothetical protein